jgi:pyrophosphate--fructose-6-phosphate 1-phosphotransferase
LEDVYRNPGPLQFEGPGADSKPISLCVEDQDYMGRIKKLQEYLEKVVLMPPTYFCFKLTGSLN